jgi:hypothetical protein
MEVIMVSNPFTYKATTVAAAANLASDAVTTPKILAANVTIPKVEAALKTGLASIALSVEAAAEQGTFWVYFNKKVTINTIRTVVTKVIGITNPATFTCGNADGASTGGVVTVDAAAAIGDLDSATPTTNNVVAKDSYYYITSSKSTTYGGKVQLFLEYTVTA